MVSFYGADDKNLSGAITGRRSDIAVSCIVNDCFNETSRPRSQRLLREYALRTLEFSWRIVATRELCSNESDGLSRVCADCKELVSEFDDACGDL